MFGIFHGDVLIGRSELESGDPPMGVASGQFEPTDAFAPLRKAMKPARDGAGKEQRDARYLAGVCARTADGIALVCSHVEVCEYGEVENPFCVGSALPRDRAAALRGTLSASREGVRGSVQKVIFRPLLLLHEGKDCLIVDAGFL
jgi:hypothetical protein